MEKEARTYSLDEIPEDTTPNTGSSTPFEPLDPLKFYQVEVYKAEFGDNKYYDPNAEDPKDRGQKYNINFEFAVVDDNEYYGRRLWKTVSTSLMPTTKKGDPTVLFKIVTAALKSPLDWDGCAAFAPDNKTLMINIEETIVGKQIIVSIENTTDPETKKVKTSIKSYNSAKTALPKFDFGKSKARGEAKKQETAVPTEEPKQKDPLGEVGTMFDKAISDIDKEKAK